MAKKKATRKAQLSPGQQIRIKPGVTVPEFPEVCCAGWTGVILEVSGKKADPKFVIEWDAATLDAMPQSYKDECEAKNYMFSYSCFPLSDMEMVDA